MVLNNSSSGDEVILSPTSNQSDAIDAVPYKQGSFPGIISIDFYGLTGRSWNIYEGHSIERNPPGQDTDDCMIDFIVRALPTPVQMLWKGSARTTKEDVILNLEVTKTDKDDSDEYADEDIDNAIKHIENSLLEEYWLDCNHIAVKTGKDVFEEEKKAAEILQKLMDKKDTADSVKDACMTAILQLIDADDSLARILYEDALEYTGIKKVDEELEKCEKELDKASEKLMKYDYDKVIHHYQKAWEHAQKAIKYGME
ncbi:MAG: hypothetical protein A2161_13125 [Candidatus Schekmanbacteria bacterium RBG_13_48_7]|uniref:Uncharacterized protein n=1 Tax=Candidatus Schekmanbacteria bacterium RBG_13_48_7 TaxID=1817878 RepID=A0A1F7RMY5_9BACT|nr:MAG: hypothetical protein A2161_13125 [Candidatus Schekmanbacteria bacterium RBG_13_48_7]